MSAPTPPTPPPLDGNAAAGELADIFGVDLTVAIGQCGGCGERGRLGESSLYLRAAGLVLRCRGCDHVLVRVVTGPDRQWVDLRGMTVLQLRQEVRGSRR